MVSDVLRCVALISVVTGSLLGAIPGHAAPVPPVMKFAGSLPLIEGPASVTFALFTEQTGGAPLWAETQNVIVEPGGRYTVVLGATRPDGLPVGLFASGEARWIGVTVNGGEDLPRVMMVSVPYALKAGDAETIGGRPLSAFVLAGDKTGVGPDGLTYVDTRVLQKALDSPAVPPAGGAIAGPPAGGGSWTVGRLSRFADGAGALTDSALFQDAVNAGTLDFVGVNTTAPQAQLHVQGTRAPAALFDVVSNSLSALPVAYRAARGTPSALAAVQTDDILGGLAVRGYDGSAWTGGRGQVMFKAAENWTPSANGTYLQFTTTPTGTSTWAERMRIAPNGYVGVGTAAPQFPLDARLARGATYARFGGNSGSPLFLMANAPNIGFNLYYDNAYLYGYAGYGGYLAFDTSAGSFLFASTSAMGGVGNTASPTTRMAITKNGFVGIGTVSPASVLDVVDANGTRVLSADAAGIFAGPGATGTPLAYGFVDGVGNYGPYMHSSNVLGVTKIRTGVYLITLSGIALTNANATAVVTQSTATPGTVGYVMTEGSLAVFTFFPGGAATDVGFSFVIFGR